jgi:hypothetical protein
MRFATIKTRKLFLDFDFLGDFSLFGLTVLHDPDPVHFTVRCRTSNFYNL